MICSRPSLVCNLRTSVLALRAAAFLAPTVWARRRLRLLAERRGPGCLARRGVALRCACQTDAEGFIKSFKGRFAPNASISICSSASTRPASHRGLKDRLQHQPLANVLTGSHQLSLQPAPTSRQRSAEQREPDRFLRIAFHDSRKRCVVAGAERRLSSLSVKIFLLPKVATRSPRLYRFHLRRDLL